MFLVPEAPEVFAETHRPLNALCDTQKHMGASCCVGGRKDHRYMIFASIRMLNAKPISMVSREVWEEAFVCGR